MKTIVLALVGLFAVTTSLSADLPVAPENVGRIAEALPAAAPATPRKPRMVLVYSKTWGFRHGSIPTGVKAMQMLGEKTHAFTAVHSEDPAMFDADKLSDFDAVIMLNTTGDCLAPEKGELTDEQQATLEQRKKNLQKLVADGGGLVGVHSASDTFYSWKTYGDMIGGWFTGHPWHERVPLKVDSPNHPLTTMFNPREDFEVTDEIYQFAPRGARQSFEGYQPYSRDKLRVLLSLDADKFDVSKGARDDKDYAVSWVHQFGQGRIFYCSLGHRDEIYWNPVVLQHYLAGIQYALGDLAADAAPSKESVAAAR